MWIGTQAREQFLLECTLLSQVVLDGLDVFGEIIGLWAAVTWVGMSSGSPVAIPARGSLFES